MVLSLKSVKGRHVALLGLTYKEGTDTLRRSWSVELAQWLSKKGARVQAYDWQLTKLPKELSRIISMQTNFDAALQDCDALVVGTDHPGIKDLQQQTIRRLKSPVIIDPNGSIDRSIINDISPIEYCSVGYALSRKKGALNG